MKKHIPNLITLLNLMSGSVAIVMVLSGQMKYALILLMASALFDFLDGMTARLLHVKSELGGQLDSLADLVSFGLLPASMALSIVLKGEMPFDIEAFNALLLADKIAAFSVLFIPAMSALRLGKFNLQEDTSYFLGLPTPALAIFWTGLYYDFSLNGTLMGQDLNNWIICSLIVFSALLMVAPIKLLSLKFKNLKFKENFTRYLLLLISLLIVAFLGIPGFPILILTYILLSMLHSLLT